MSTVLNTNGELLNVGQIVNKEEFRCVIVTARWNSEITYAMRDGAIDLFKEAGIDSAQVSVVEVPGTVELVNAAAAVVKNPKVKAVIVIGCVVRGDTPHFDYVCHIAAEGVAALNVKGETPVIFGVLTVENYQQALDRAGGKLGNKGAEAAAAAIEMANLHVGLRTR